MIGPMKRWCWLLALLLTGCARPEETASVRGKTMGTTYQVTYVSTEWRDTARRQQLAKAIDDLLVEINQSMSTFIESSTISQINMATDLDQWHPVDRHFQTVLKRSREVYDDTNHAFNPAVGPLVNAWGFGPENPEEFPDDAAVHALLKVVNFDSFEFRESPPSVRKHIAGAKLDFSAIAKGYGVDAIGTLLEQRGVTNYLVEIGGEVRARGQHANGHPWRIGIERPADNVVADRTIQSVIELENSGLATSGTYRNYEIKDGKRIAHIIDPATGYPAQNSLLSVSVIAGDTMTADAYATALMVMGLDDGLRFVEARKDLKAYFIATDGSKKLVEKRSSGFPSAANE
jgi:thiamine biosynthesis lipoprotein